MWGHQGRTAVVLALGVIGRVVVVVDSMRFTSAHRRKRLPCPTRLPRLREWMRSALIHATQQTTPPTTRATS